MPYATITGWGKCVPPAVLTNDDLATFMDTNDEWIYSRTGIRQRHISHVNTSELATVAAKRALAAAGLDPSDIDMILLASTSANTAFPSTAALVQQALGAKCAALDINAACSGFLYGLGLASAQIRSGQMQRVLVIGAERLSFLINWSRRETAVLFGDGAGAIVLEASAQQGGVLAYQLNNDPTGADILKTEFGSSMDRFDPASLDFTITFDGPEIFKRAVTGMGSLAKQVMRECELAVDDLDIVIPHQANERIIDTLISRLKVPKDKAFINIANYGNTSASTIPIALCDALAQGRITPHAKILTCAFGAGLSSAAAIIQWGERVKPIATSDAELPSCTQTALELIAPAIAHFCPETEVLG